MKSATASTSKSFVRGWSGGPRKRFAIPLVLSVMVGALAACGFDDDTGQFAAPIVAGLAHGLLHGPDRTAHSTPRQKAPAAGRYALTSSTPALPFNGNQLVVVDPELPDGSNVAAASLQRAANCTLTETVTEPVSGIFSPPASLDLPNAQDYFHQLAGLTTQADVFPQGCVDSLRGKRSVFTIRPISLTSTTLRFVDINSSTEQLEATSVDRTSGAVTTTTLTTGRTQGFAVVDVNGDGLNDIVASGVGFSAGVNGNIVVFVNNGDGTYRTAATIPNAGSTFTVDDVNGDGKVDIVIDNGFVSGTQVPGVSTLLGNGDGTFQTAVASAAGATQVIGPMITGDFNGDGKLDVLLGSQILFGVGDGTFVAGPAFPTSLSNQIGFNAAVGDLNHDGKLDVVYTGFGFVQVLLGNGDGTFSVGARYASLGSSQPVSVSEIDGDGNLDIIVGNASQGLVFGTFDDSFVKRFQVLLGHGDGTFVAAPLYPGDFMQNGSANQVATADFDGDGKVDVVVADNATGNGLDVLPGTGQSVLGAAIRSATAIRASMVVAVDLNGDAKPDVVAAGQDTGGNFIVATLLNQGGGHLAAEHDYAIPAFPDAIAVGDFDGDGRPDIAVAVGSVSFASTGPPGVYVLYGQADGTFTAPVQVDGSTLPQSLAVADINGDGRADLAVVDFGPGTTNGVGALHVYLGRADRTFGAAATPVATGATRFTAVAFGDIDGDGRQDLVVGATVPGASFGSLTPNVYTFLGHGDGTFGAAHVEPTLGTDGDINALAIADFDHDGHADVVVGIQNDYTEVLLGVGDGTYGHNLLALGEHPNSIVAADLDADHFPELLIGTAGDGLAVLRNAGTAAAWAGTTVTGPTTPTTGDFTVTATPTTGSVVAGQSAQTTIAVAPSGGFNQTVTLACTSGLPTNATCSFSPASLTPTGSAAASSSLTIATHAASASAAGSIESFGGTDGSGGWPGGLLVGVLAGATLLARRRRPAFARAVGFVAVAGLVASCGGSGGDDSSAGATAPSGPTGTSFAITITATSGSTSHSAVYTLTVH